MSSGAVVGTIRITICAPRSFSIAASLALSASACAGVSVAGLVDDAAGEDGTGRRPAPLRRRRAERTRRAGAAAARTARIGRRRAVSATRACRSSPRGGTEICASFGDREARLDLVAEDHRREVGRDAAHLDVVLWTAAMYLLRATVIRFSVPSSCDAQVLERLVGLQVRIVLGDDQQAAQRAAQLALRLPGTCRTPRDR